MNASKKSGRQLTISAIAVAVLVLLDQLTKLLATAGLKGGTDFPLLRGILEFHYLENQSAAFSIDPVSLLQKLFHFPRWENDPSAFLQAKMTFFIILTFVVILLMAFVYTKVPADRHFRALDVILIAFISGALGNLIDRIRCQYVVDFIYFKLIDFPVFNVADIYVTCASFALIFVVLFYYREEDFEQIFPSHNGKTGREEK